MSQILSLPEIRGLDCPQGLFRIPDQIDVPVTDRVKRLVNTAAFRRLADIPQLGLVSLVYPGATHTRFEHSLGVYKNTLLFLRQIAHTSDLATKVSRTDGEAIIVAALFHDVGHWPFCHPIEDIGLADVPEHESVAAEHILGQEISELIRRDWGFEPQRAVDLLAGQVKTPADSILTSILSGPIDVDKMDYLYRDSLHAGVPYGRNFDAPRLINSLTLNEAGDGIAISNKGKTAAELMVFARYVMFSEVYWHHAVRSATTMFQRAFYDWYLENLDGQCDWCHWGTAEWTTALLHSNAPESTQSIAMGIFGPKRRLYKRLASFAAADSNSIFRTIAHQPFDWLLKTSNKLAELISSETGGTIQPHHVLIDAPPVGLEVQFDVDVIDQRTGQSRRLGDISPVVQALAKRQFDDFVKQVRVFVDPSVSDAAKSTDIESLLATAANSH